MSNVKNSTKNQLTNGKFIVVRILGGLGNQMFQYACAKTFASNKNAVLILDTTYYNHTYRNMTYRKYQLSTFSLDADILSEDILSQLPEELNIYEEDLWYKYEECLFEMETPCYLVGYWQSWKYFQSMRQNLCEDFYFSEQFLSSDIKNLAIELSQKQSVGIHVRRTDYAYHPHGILPIHYYQNAIRYINQQINCPVFYVFSDDPDWVEDNFDIRKSFLVIKGNTDIEDMYLMSQCKHNIIANSTFSWWAAWLNSNPDKIVIVPQNGLLMKISMSKILI